MLPVAAATATGEAAGGISARRTGPKDLEHASFRELRFAGGEFDAEKIARGRLVDKNNKAVVTGDSPPADGHFFDLDLQ